MPDPITTSALIKAGADVFGNLFGSFSQNKTNQMNMDFSREMLQKQMDYNTQMWNAQNKYNSPVEQVKRLNAAGINPYVGLGLLNSGSAQSAGGVNPPSASAQPFRPDFSGIGDAAQTYAAQKIQNDVNQSVINQNDSIAELNREQSKYYGIKAIAEIQDKISSSANNTQKAIWQSIMNGYGDQIFSSDILEKQRRSDYLLAQTRGQLVQNAIDSIHLIQLPEKYKLEFASIMATTALRVAQKQLTNNQATATVYEWLNTLEDGVTKSINNNILRQTMDDLIEQAEWTTDFKPYQDVIGLALGTAEAAMNFKPKPRSPRKIGKKSRYIGSDGKSYDTSTLYLYE